MSRSPGRFVSSKIPRRPARGQKRWHSSSSALDPSNSRLGGCSSCRTGRWPATTSGPIADTEKETWRKVHAALANGFRGLPGGSSLARLLAQKRAVRNVMNLPPFRIPELLRWADATPCSPRHVAEMQLRFNSRSSGGDVDQGPNRARQWKARTARRFIACSAACRQPQRQKRRDLSQLRIPEIEPRLTDVRHDNPVAPEVDRIVKRLVDG